MAGPDSLPKVFRASDEDRDEAIRMLRDGSVEGRLSSETFLARVERALQARSADELAQLLRDLPPRPPRGVTGWQAGGPDSPPRSGSRGPPPACPRWPCRAGPGRCSPSAGPRTLT